MVMDKFKERHINQTLAICDFFMSILTACIANPHKLSRVSFDEYVVGEVYFYPFLEYLTS